MSCNTKPEKHSLLSPGISSELAAYRSQQISDVVYNLSFSIPIEKEDAIDSQLELELQINDLEHPLYLDFNVDSSHLKSVMVNDEQIPINHQEGHIIIDVESLKKGKNEIHIQFVAGELSLNRNEDYLYTLLVPDRASTLFPCFDQPNLKARYVLDVTAPKNWKVLSGAHLNFKESKGDVIKYQFKESDLMSTYLFSFVAGVFEEANEKIDSFNFKLLYRETDSAKIEASVDEIFRLHNESIIFLEDYTQFKFPFQKLDFAAIPGFQYGGMEHVGAIQYNEASLFLDGNATQKEKMGRYHLIAHETAHMWFGDLVTMKWFDDVWLKEVFANFLADKITNPAFPEVNHDLTFMSEHYTSAYSEDRTKGATPIKQNLDNLKNAGTLYGNIIYDKAPIMMRQLEALVGENVFKQGIRKYIKKFANANADWSDLVSILGEETNFDLKAWSDVWVNQPGRPIIADEVYYENDIISNFRIRQKAENGNSNIWQQQFSLGLVYSDSIVEIPVKITKQEQSLGGMVGLTKPQYIIYNYNALGYGVFPLDDSQISGIPKIKDDVARGYSYINLYENVLTGNVPPQKALETLVEGAVVETEELILNNVIGYISSIFWNYIKPESRAELGLFLESKLKARLFAKQDSASIKKTLFYLYRDIAYSETGRDVLYDIWNKSLKIDSLMLHENDYSALAATLAVFNHPKTDTILRKALEDISNPDRKKRFEFLLPSLSNNENTRDKFMLSLTKAENREKESWVLSALYNMHHPLRQESAKKHLRTSLDLVEEIQKTGDIFFPKAWLNATIGSYTSNEALQILDGFVQENPNFPVELNNKLLQASDKLYRAKLIREKWE